MTEEERLRRGAEGREMTRVSAGEVGTNDTGRT